MNLGKNTVLYANLKSIEGGISVFEPAYFTDGTNANITVTVPRSYLCLGQIPEKNALYPLVIAKSTSSSPLGFLVANPRMYGLPEIDMIIFGCKSDHKIPGDRWVMNSNKFGYEEIDGYFYHESPNRKSYYRMKITSIKNGQRIKTAFFGVTSVGNEDENSLYEELLVSGKPFWWKFRHQHQKS